MSCYIERLENRLLLTADIYGTTSFQLSAGPYYQEVAGRTIYIDANNNGALDAGEISAVSEYHGSYVLHVPGPGTYTVRQVVPAGYVQTLPTSNGARLVTIAAGQTDSFDNDFATLLTAPTGNVSVRVFNDVNANGVFDAGEQGIADRVVSINYSLDSSEGPDAVTDSNGMASIAGIAPGTWALGVDDVDGWIRTPPIDSSYYHMVTVASGQTTATQTVGLVDESSVGRISGFVFYDRNENSINDAEYSLLSNRTVYIDADNDGALDANERRIVTQVDGYWFDAVLPGTYTLRQISPAGWRQTSPPDNPATTLTVRAGQALRFNFGTTLDPSTLSKTLPAVADAYVRDGTSATTNFGSAGELHVSNSSTTGSRREGYLRFDLRSLDSSAINRAKLRLFGRQSATATGVPLAVYGSANASWSESSVNWNNKPATNTALLAQQTIGGTAGAWYEFDVTAYLQQLKAAGAQFVTFALKNTASSSSYTILNSDEAASNRPQLRITQASVPQMLVLSKYRTEMAEGSSTSFTAQLSNRPSSYVSLVVEMLGSLDVRTDQNFIEFSPDDWDVPQTVRITAAEDTDLVADSASIIVEDFDGLLETQSLLVKVIDNDAPVPPEIVLSSSTLKVPEKGQASVQVSLSRQPPSNVVVSAYHQSGDADLSAIPVPGIGFSLTFTPQNWNVPQALPIYAADDPDALDGWAIFEVRSSGLNSKALSVTEADDDQTGGTVTRSAVDDAYVRDSATSTNYGSASQLEVKKSSTGYNREAYLRFDVSNISNLTSAKLRVFGRLSQAATGVATAAYGAATNWSEGALTWNTRPATLTGALASQTIGSTSGQWYEFDVTQFVAQQRAAGATHVAFALKNTGGNSSYTIFNSDEAAGDKPQLVLVTNGEPPPPPPPTQGLIVSDTTMNVAEGSTLTFGVRLAAQPAVNVTVNIARQSGDASLSPTIATLTFTPANWDLPQVVGIAAAEDVDTLNGQANIVVSSQGLTSKTIVATEIDNDAAQQPTVLPAAHDAYVKDGASASSNYGPLTELQVKQSSAGYNRESYLRFDLSGVTGSIGSAKLRLFGRLSQAATAVTTQVYGSSNLTWLENTLTWNNRPAASTSALASKSVSGTAGAWYEFDLTGYLQQQKAAGATSVTLILRNTGGNSSYTIFNSAEAASNAPELVVTT